MLELNISKNNNSNSQAYGKHYARVEYKKTLSIHDMAKHMAEHNTPFSVGTIEGILRDFVSCTREQCLSGNTVKIDDLAIIKCSVNSNGMLLREGYRVTAGLGSLPATKNADGSSRTPDYTKEIQYAICSVRLHAQATGEFTNKELNDDASFRWTKAAQQTIDSLLKPSGTTDPTGSGSNGNSGSNNPGSGDGGNSGGGAPLDDDNND